MALSLSFLKLTIRPDIQENGPFFLIGPFGYSKRFLALGPVQPTRERSDGHFIRAFSSSNSM